MIISPIIPIWLMVIICLIFIILKSKNIKKYFRQIIIVILLFIINLRIMYPNKNGKVMETNLDILFVIDNTISMMAEDYKNSETRLDAVKEDCKYIINELSGSNFSVITFDNSSKIVTPLTKDQNITIGAIDSMYAMDKSYAMGSSMNTALEDLEDSLKRADEKKDRNSIVFFISDGEITNDETLKSFSSIKKYIVNGAVLGYGTSAGGYMKVKDPLYETEEYIKDNEDINKNAISKIDENNLKKIAKDMDIEYIHMEKKENINSKIKEIKNKEIQSLDNTDKSLYNDTYFIFVIPLAGLLIYEFIDYSKKLHIQQQ